MKFSACSMASHYCSEVFYCDLCNNSSNLFGCIGLNRQQYCILNKQYSPAEYLALKAEIIAQMTADGTWGEFFPSKMSPFGYNETVANEYFTLSKKEALESQLFWRETEARGFYDGPEIELPDSIHNTADDVASKVLCCEATTRPYKVILPELQFYRQIGVPVPRRSPIQRHTDRLAMRNRRALWHSKCDDCSQEITTSTSPDSPNRTVCSECYLRLVAE